jgi:LacI family transcriptional regulator
MWIVWDIWDAMYQSVYYLYRKGHRNIMYFGGVKKPYRDFQIRWDAFRSALESLNLPFLEHQHLIKYDNDTDLVALFDQKLKSNPITALICGLHFQVAWVFYACSMLNISIPKNYSLVSLVYKQDSMLPQMTRPEIPIFETGRRAVDRMFWRLANPSSLFEHTKVTGAFFEGETVLERPLV